MDWIDTRKPQHPFIHVGIKQPAKDFIHHQTAKVADYKSTVTEKLNISSGRAEKSAGKGDDVG